MKPTAENFPCQVTAEQIAAAFVAAGAVPGDTIVFHSSLKSLGYVVNGAPAVIDGVLQAAGYGGTVAVPTLWYRQNTPEYRAENFDPATSPAWNGAVAEAMRRDPRSVRSCHFSHAVSAIGSRAAELVRDHGAGRSFPAPWSETAFAEISPWSKFYAWNALLGLIGVDADTATMRHWIESRFVAHALAQLPAAERPAARLELRHDRLPGVWAGFGGPIIREELEALGLGRRVALGATTVFAVRVRPFVDYSWHQLSWAPEKYFQAPFVEWLQRHHWTPQEGTLTDLL